jgi:predicted Zn-dependent peptidase
MSTGRSERPNLNPDVTFRRTVLDGGVRVVTERIPSVRSVSVGVWIFVGSRDERREEAGISHFIEHMVFKGTSHRKTHHLAARMESVGGFLNAFTAKEYTCFFARGLDQHLARAVDVLADMVLSPAFPEKELVKEKDVVLEEMKMYRDNPEDHIFDQYDDAIYRGHALSRPILGTESAVSSFDRQRLFDFVNRQYTPERIVVAAAGNVDHDEVAREVAKGFAALTRTGQRRRRTRPREHRPFQASVAVPTQQAHIVLGGRGCGLYDDDRLGLIVLNTLLGGGMSSRLNLHIRERYGFCYQVYSFVNMYLDTGDWGVYMGTDGSRIARARKLIHRELDLLATKRVGPRELSQAKSQVKGSIMLGLESMNTRMMRLGRQELFHKRFVSLDEAIDQIDAVTADDLREVAEKLFDSSKFSEIVFHPNGKDQSEK